MKYNLTTKPDKAAAWATTVKVNSDNGYGEAVLQVIENLGKALDDGKTPAEAEKIATKDSGITGFQAGIMASLIYQLHPRGEEFKRYFNAQMGADPEAKGTVNPAIMTIGG